MASHVALVFLSWVPFVVLWYDHLEPLIKLIKYLTLVTQEIASGILAYRLVRFLSN